MCEMHKLFSIKIFSRRIITFIIPSFFALLARSDAAHAWRTKINYRQRRIAKREVDKEEQQREKSIKKNSKERSRL